MKKLLTMLAMALLFGCGGGSSTPEPTPTAPLPLGLVGTWQSGPTATWPTYVEVVQDGDTYVAYIEHIYTADLWIQGFFESTDQTLTKTFIMTSGQQTMDLAEVRLTTIEGTRDQATYQIIRINQVGTPSFSHQGALTRISN